MILCAATGIAAGEPLGSDADSSQAWHVSADRIDYDQTRDAYTAVGNVAVTREGRILNADRVQLNQKSRQAFAQGNVRLTSGDDVLSGKRLLLNLDTETGTLTEGTLFISKNHLYLSGQKIQKTGPQTYKADKVSITSCDGPDPDWELTGRKLKVTVEGYGYATNTALWAGNIPVLYSPFLVFPVKLKRQSGLLMPELGYSNRKGSQYLQPLYWAINDQSDATLYAHQMTERGVRTGLEYRYVVDENTRGTILAEGFQDKRVDDGQDENSRLWGYEDDDALRTNKDRYWIRAKHDHGYASGWNAKIDIDVVSDQDYLAEFRSGRFGFDETQSYFQDTFGRTIDDYNDPIRLNRFNLNRTWNRYSLNADARWYDDVIKRRTDATDDTLQQLPVVTFDGVKQPLAKSPIYFDLTSSYTHFYRINGTRGHRADLYPRVYYPTALWKVLSIEPSVGIRQTAWQIDYYENRPDHDRNTLYRSIYDAKLDLSTEFYRIYGFGLAGNDRLKHALTPEVVYEYTPEEDQSDFPEFDELDRIERKNLITYGFTNTLTARAPKLSEDGESFFSYTPFLRLKVSQSFDINKDREDDPEPFSAILAELDVTPGRYLSLDTDAQWSPYNNELESFNTTLRLWDLRGDSLGFDYRFTREDPEQALDGIETITVSGELVLTDRWRARAGYDYNLFDDQEIEARAGLSYQSQCWGVDIDYKIEEGENSSVNVLFNLTGIGSLGG
ncbi:MAG: LPS assembly protein LptD [Desulfobacteraceae bacterium]